MCGLYGCISSDLYPVDLESMYIVGTLSVLRGMDSAGLAVVAPKDNAKNAFSVAVYKQVTNSAALLSDKKIRKQLEETNKVCVLGHSRAATVGQINKNNCHPFIINNELIGAMNGTIEAFVKWKMVPGKVWKGKELVDGHVKVLENPNENDSRTLFQRLYQDGLQSLVNDIRDCDGAAALSWIDHRDNTLNFWRNEKRPLYFMRSSDSSTLYWSSDEDHLKFAKNRAYGSGHFPFGAAINTHYKIPFGCHIDKWSVSTVSPISKVVRAIGFEMGRDDDDVWDNYTKKETLTERFIRERKETENKGRVGHWRAMHSRDRGSVTFYEFYEARESSAAHKDGIKKLSNPMEITDTELEEVIKPGKDIKNVLWTGWYTLNPLNEEGGNQALAKGCACCKSIATVWAKTHWVGPTTYYCDDCIDTLLVSRFLEQSRLQVRESAVAWEVS